TTTSESTRASGKAVPPGDGTLAKAASTCSLFTVMITVHFVGATRGKAAGWSMWRVTTETGRRACPGNDLLADRHRLRPAKGYSKLVREIYDGEGSVSWPGGSGVPHGGAFEEQRRARCNRLQPDCRQGRPMGQAARRQIGAHSQICSRGSGRRYGVCRQR